MEAAREENMKGAPKKTGKKAATDQSLKKAATAKSSKQAKGKRQTRYIQHLGIYMILRRRMIGLIEANYGDAWREQG